MIATHETLWLDATGTTAKALTPGRVQRALAKALRLSSDAIGVMSPLGRGRVAVDIALPRALNIATPLTLSVSDDGQQNLFVLRRESDPTTEQHTELRITWKGKTPPTPGQVVEALTRASENQFDTGDLDAVFEGSDRLVATVSEGLRYRLSLPATVSVSGLALTLSENGHAAS